MKIEERAEGACASASASSRLKRAVIAAFVALVVFALAIPAGSAWADDETSWDISKSKTATNLDENFESKVTLSLPSAEEQLVSDVVFVLDKSTSAELEDQALEMLQGLQEQLDNTGAKVKVGVVIFNKEAHASGFFDLATQYEQIKAAIAQNISSGTNTHAGLLAGIDMLEKDAAVDDSRKYLVFVSDGITYMYNESPTATAWSFNNPDAEGDWHGKGSWASWSGPDNWYSKYHSNEAPSDWGVWMEDIAQKVEGQDTQYEYSYGSEPTELTPEDIEDWDSDYAMSIDKALYLTHQAYREAATKYHCYAMVAESEAAAKYLWGPSFVNYLANDKTVSFDQIENDIVYLVDAGSSVEDYMGYVEDDYDFDFVNDASALELKVGDTTYKAVRISDDKYGFKPLGGSYAYTVTYVRGNDQDEEHFVWNINEAVTNFNPVQLTYTVKLTNPKTEAGTYGTYDADGSQGYSGLYTNTSATLYPVSTSGAGASEDFNKPTVSYTVEEQVTPTVPPTTEDDPSGDDNNQTTNNESNSSATVSVTTSGTTDNTSSSSPKTGDAFGLAPLVALLVVAGASGAGIFAWRKLR